MSEGHRHEACGMNTGQGVAMKQGSEFRVDGTNVFFFSLLGRIIFTIAFINCCLLVCELCDRFFWPLFYFTVDWECWSLREKLV